MTKSNDKKIRNYFPLLTGRDNWSSAGSEELPSLRMSDGPHGLRYVTEERDGEQISKPSVCYPTLSALGNSFERRACIPRGSMATAEGLYRENVAVFSDPESILNALPCAEET